MPTVEELLEKTETYAETGEAKEQGIYCVIDPETRTIAVPEEYRLLGVESDEKVERIWFQCPKIVGDNIDLSQLQLRINYQNANSQKDQYIVTDVQDEGDNVIFSWLLSRKVTAYRGQVSFIVCAVKVSGETIQNEWNTTLATAQVLEGLEVDTPEPTEEQSDVIAQLLQIVKDTSEQAVADVGSAKTDALGEIGTSKTDALDAIAQQKADGVSAVQSAQSTAVTAVQNAGQLIEESLPSDYTELSDMVELLERTKAPAIVGNASGESIEISDGADMPLTDIKLYGKSKQAMTTGAQLFDVSAQVDGFIASADGDLKDSEVSVSSDYVAVMPLTEYSLSYSVTEIVTIRPIAFYDADKAFLSSILYHTDVVADVNKQFETPDGCYYIRFTVLKSGTNVMLNEGSSALPWEPYTGGKPSPSIDYPQEIHIPGEDGNINANFTGNQLFDVKRIISKSASNSHLIKMMMEV